MRCKACSKEAIHSDFCSLHLKAYENIMEKYSAWRKALNLTWEAYLSTIAKNSLTGNYTKEVAKYLINKEEIENGKKI